MYYRSNPLASLSQLRITAPFAVFVLLFSLIGSLASRAKAQIVTFQLTNVQFTVGDVSQSYGPQTATGTVTADLGSGQITSAHIVTTADPAADPYFNLKGFPSSTYTESGASISVSNYGNVSYVELSFQTADPYADNGIVLLSASGFTSNLSGGVPSLLVNEVSGLNIYTHLNRVAPGGGSGKSGGSLTVAPPVTITTPSTNAKPDSNYIALTGTGPASGTVAVLVDGTPRARTNLDANGNWETVAYLGSGNHNIVAEDANNPNNVSMAITATPTIDDYTLVPALTITNYSLLRKSDIFLTIGLNSPQIKYFIGPIGIPTTGFEYTHTALYLGSDIQGTPMIAEAVTAQEGGTFGAVRDVPLEASTVWTDGTQVDIYRPTIPLSDPQRAAVVTWAQGVTNQNLPYWSDSDFLLFVEAWNQWNPFKDQPYISFIFQNFLNALDNVKYATNRFICSTLVWHAYYAGTDGTVDLSLPNNATPKALIGAVIRDKLLQTLQPHFVFPDTLAGDGKLQKVN